MSDVHGWGTGSSDAADRDRGVRRARRLRNGVVATGVAGSLGLAGVAAVTTIAGGVPGATSSAGTSGGAQAAQPQTRQHQPTRLSGEEGGDDGWVVEDDGGLVVQQPLRPLFQQPKPPAPGSGTLPHAGSSGS